MTNARSRSLVDGYALGKVGRGYYSVFEQVLSFSWPAVRFRLPVLKIFIFVWSYKISRCVELYCKLLPNIQLMSRIFVFECMYLCYLLWASCFPASGYLLRMERVWTWSLLFLLQIIFHSAGIYSEFLPPSPAIYWRWTNFLLSTNCTPGYFCNPSWSRTCGNNINNKKK